MPEVIIKYEKPETLRVLEELAKSMDFKVFKENDKVYFINGVTIVKRNKDADFSDIRQLFTEKNIDAKTLRKKLGNAKSNL